MLKIKNEIDQLVKELVESSGYQYCQPNWSDQWDGDVMLTNPMEKYCLLHDQPYRYCKEFQNNSEAAILAILNKYTINE